MSLLGLFAVENNVTSQGEFVRCRKWCDVTMAKCPLNKFRRNGKKIFLLLLQRIITALKTDLTLTF